MKIYLKNIRLKLYPGIDAMSHGELKEINRLKSFWKHKIFRFKLLMVLFYGNLGSFKKKDSTPYKVYSPFLKEVVLMPLHQRQPTHKPKKLNLLDFENKKSAIEDLKLVQTQKLGENDSKKMEYIGNHLPNETKNIFFNSKIFKYKNGRNFPSNEFSILPITIYSLGPDFCK